MFIRGNLSRGKANLLISLSIFFDYSYFGMYGWKQYLMGFQQEGETEGYVVTLVFTATLVWHNVGRQSDCPWDTENNDPLCTQLEVLGLVQ